MKGTLKTIYLGCKTKASKDGERSYRLVSFMDEGEPCNAVLDNSFKGELPKAMSEVTLEINVELGRFTSIKVVNIVA